MIKQLEVSGRKSFDDFGLLISSRKISQPKKKIIKQEIPFSNIVYDFSKINGEIYWDERELTYTFDIAENSTEEMERIKSEVYDWLMNIHDEDIFDPYISNFHFHGSFDGESWDEDFGQGVIEVSFIVYPYMIANEETNEVLDFHTVDEVSITVENKSSHRIIPEITVVLTEKEIEFNGVKYSLDVGVHTLSDFYLEPGINEMKVSGGGSMILRYREERF